MARSSITEIYVMITPSLLGVPPPLSRHHPRPGMISNITPLVLAFKSVKHLSSFKRKRKESAAAQQPKAKKSNDRQEVVQLKVVFSIVFVTSGFLKKTAPSPMPTAHCHRRTVIFVILLILKNENETPQAVFFALPLAHQ